MKRTLLVTFVCLSFPSCIEVPPKAVEITPELSVVSPKQTVAAEPTVVVQGQDNVTQQTTSNTTTNNDAFQGQLATIGLAAVAMLLVLSYPFGKVVWLLGAWMLGTSHARTHAKKKNAAKSAKKSRKNLTGAQNAKYTLSPKERIFSSDPNTPAKTFKDLHTPERGTMSALNAPS